MGFYGPGLSAPSPLDPTRRYSRPGTPGLPPDQPADNPAADLDVLQLQQQNAALQSEVARLKGLLTQSCPSNAWAAVLANNASTSSSCSTPSEGCACPCHALAAQFAGALVRYKGLLAQLQQQVLHLQAELARRSAVVLEADAILHSTATALQPLADLTTTPLTTPAHTTQQQQQQQRRSGVASSGSRGQGSGSGRLPPAQQQRGPSAGAVCGAEEVLEVAAGLREWCGAMQQRLASARAIAADMYLRPHSRDTGGGSSSRGHAADNAFCGAPVLASPPDPQYVPVGGNQLLAASTSHLPQRPSPSAQQPWQRSSITSSSRPSTAAAAAAHVPACCSLTQLCEGRGLAAAEVGALHALEVQLAALAPRLAAFALALRVQLLPLLPWLGGQAGQQLLDSTAGLAQEAGAAAVGLSQLSCLLPAGPVKGAAAVAGSAKAAAGRLRAQQGAGARGDASSCGADQAAPAHDPDVTAAAGGVPRVQDADPELFGDLQRLQEQVAGAAACATKLACITSSSSSTPGKRLTAAQTEQQAQHQAGLVRHLRDAQQALQLVSRGVTRHLWSHQVLVTQLRVLAGCGAAGGRLVAGLVQQLAEALTDAAAAAEDPALAPARGRALSAVSRLVRAAALVRQRPGDGSALRSLLEVTEEEEVLGALPELLRAAAAPALQAAGLAALRGAFASYRDAVEQQQRHCSAQATHCKQQLTQVA